MDWTKKTFKQLAQERPKRKKKDNSTKNDYFIFCRSCNTQIENDYRSPFDKRYCADCS
jgi:hypothetical protein